jgi:hypothetical protein
MAYKHSVRFLFLITGCEMKTIFEELSLDSR